MPDEFEWDPANASANRKKHGVRFEHATGLSTTLSHGSKSTSTPDTVKIVSFFRAGNDVLIVVYTERDERIRIISARKAESYQPRDYYRAAEQD